MILNRVLTKHIDLIKIPQEAKDNFELFKAKIENILQSKEEQYQYGFLDDLFVKILGYTLNPSPNYNLTTEFKNQSDSKKADGSILIDGNPIGVIELKSTKLKSMDKIVSQAFYYKSNHPTCRYIITSNFEYLRLYIDYSHEFIEFHLFNLSEYEFKKLYLLLNVENLLNDLPQKLKDESKELEDSISNQFYKEYHEIRIELFQNIKHNNPQTESLQAIELTQKLLDRCIFIFFAEDKAIIDNKTSESIIKRFKEDLEKRELYLFVKLLFKAINEGNDRLNITSYNGGLFKDDELLNSLKIDDDILLKLLNLSKYDFDSDLDINILGHIFENSLSDLDELKENLLGLKENKRKKDGIFYTPDYITHFIIDNTIGKLCKAKKEALKLDNIDSSEVIDGDKLDRLNQYREFLINLKIIDPACGSGAFLNQAFNYLLIEYRFLFEYLNKIAYNKGNLLNFESIDLMILENNLFGVDINAESVEIAKLSLWLKTAKKGRKLTNLNNNIKIGNSLISDKSVDSKAFNWQEEFKEIFANGGFDIVVGNPPYVRQESIKELKPHLQHYKTYSGTADLYVYFYELAYNLLKDDGINGFICSNKFFRAKYGEALRGFILENMSLDTIVDFNGVKVFESATVDSVITILLKSKSPKEFRFSQANLKNFCNLSQASLSKESFSFSNPKELELKNRIESIGTPLKEWDIKINYGIKTGLNEAFIIDGATKDKLIEQDSKSSEIIKPILRGRDIKRYSYEFADLWLINTHNNPPIDINEYPAIKKHLDKFYSQLEQRSDQGETPYHLRSCAYYKDFEKEKIVYSEIVQKPQFYLNGGKFLYAEATTFIMTGENLKYLVTLLNSKCVTYIFKRFYMGTELGNKGFRYKKAFIELLPIPQISLKSQQPFIESADKMLNLNREFTTIKKEFLDEIKSYYKLKKLNTKLESFESLNFDEFKDEIAKITKIRFSSAVETKKFKSYWSELFAQESNRLKNLKREINRVDREIDELVYKLYQLNDDEITIIENSLN